MFYNMDADAWDSPCTHPPLGPPWWCRQTVSGDNCITSCSIPDDHKQWGTAGMPFLRTTPL